MSKQAGRLMKNLFSTALWLFAAWLTIPAANALTLTVGVGHYATLQGAFNAANPGDIINIDPGDYYQALTINKSGTAANKLTLRKTPGSTGDVNIRASELTANTDWARIGTTTVFKITFVNNHYGSFNPFQTLWPAHGSNSLVDQQNRISAGGVFVDESMYLQYRDMTAAGLPSGSSDSTVASKLGAGQWYSDVFALENNPAITTTTIYVNFGVTSLGTKKIELTRRPFCIAAAWNQKFIVLDGLTFLHAAGVKDEGYWRPAAVSGAGAVRTQAGFSWTIRNNTFKQNTGAGLDYGNGSRADELNPSLGNGSAPSEFGEHTISNNWFIENGSNGAFAYKSPYTKITGNSFINNDKNDTHTVSEAYLKVVDNGQGMQVIGNYFYRDLNTPLPIALWMDTEVQEAIVSNNVFVRTGDIIFELDVAGNNLFANNILIDGPGFSANETAQTYLVHNLFLDPTRVNIKGTFGGGGENAYPDPATGMTRRRASFFDTPNHAYNEVDQVNFFQAYETENKYYNNILYGKGITVPAEPTSDGFLKRNFVDYNMNFAGATKPGNYDSTKTPDVHSTVSVGGSYAYTATAAYCTITLNLGGTAPITAPLISGSTPDTYAGNMILESNKALFAAYGITSAVFSAVTKDFFGQNRVTIIPGPFNALSSNSNTFTLWGTAP